mgnify:CR=1 FL=1
MQKLLKGEINYKDVKEEISYYNWSHMVKLGYLKQTEKGFILAKELPKEKQLKLEIAISNYKERYPNKVRNKGVSKEDIEEWLEMIFIQDGFFPLNDFMKEMNVKNIRYLTQVLSELEYIKSVQRLGTEILVDEFDLDLVYEMYKKAVKGHTQKYKKPKRSYNSIYE